MRAAAATVTLMAGATIRRLASTALAGLAIAWAGTAALPPLPSAGTDAATVALLWLHVPCALLGIAAVGLALELWPGYCRDRPGAAALLRLRPPAVDGCVPALVGSALGLGALLAVAATGFCAIVASQGALASSVHAYLQVAIAEPWPILDDERPVLRLRGSPDIAVQALRLDPLVFWDRAGELRPAELRVMANGEPLHERAFAVGGLEGSVVIPLPPAPLPAAELTLAPGSGLALWFPPGSIEAIAAAERSALANAVLAALSYLLPLVQALALATLLRRRLALPVALTAGAAWVVLSALIEGMPTHAAIAAFAARRWLPAEDIAVGLAATLTAGLLALAALVPRPR